MAPIDNFHATGMRFLSNFYLVNVTAWQLTFPSLEHAYVACKTRVQAERELISTLPTPGEAKKFGRGIKMQGRIISLRPDFDDHKVEWMGKLLERKFTHPDLMERLKATSPRELIEGNRWHDNFWGDCYCAKCSAIPGKNLLGQMLMEIRESGKIQ